MAATHKAPMVPSIRPPLGAKGLTGSQAGGKGKTRPGPGGKGMAVGTGPMGRRHRKIMRDTISAISKGDIRRLARRGGVKRMSGAVYDEMRTAIKDHLQTILRDVCIYVEHSNRKTATVTDVIFALSRIGRPIYGFDPATFKGGK